MNKRTVKVSKRILASILLLSLSLGLMAAARVSSAFADGYTAHVYPALVSVIGRFFGLFPFSFVEIALYGAILFWAACLIRAIGKSAAHWKDLARSLLLFLSALLFSYTLCCGVNYSHTSFAELTGLTPEGYTTEDLTALCVYLTEQVNRLAPEMERAADGTALMTCETAAGMDTSTGRDSSPEGRRVSRIPQRAQETLEHLGSIYPEMAGYYPRPKPLLLSYILSVQNLTGIYSPFTVEANYNQDMTAYNQPFTACHELSHLRGFMQEEEANYLAFQACIHSDYADFCYSGYLSGWLYATNQLYRADPEAYQALRGDLDPGARADLAANDAFWARYDGRVAEVANRINDNYLKANGQNDGVKSYGRMVDLMLAYYKS